MLESKIFEFKIGVNSREVDLEQEPGVFIDQVLSFAGEEVARINAEAKNLLEELPQGSGMLQEIKKKIEISTAEIEKAFLKMKMDLNEFRTAKESGRIADRLNKELKKFDNRIRSIAGTIEKNITAAELLATSSAEAKAPVAGKDKAREEKSHLGAEREAFFYQEVTEELERTNWADYHFTVPLHHEDKNEKYTSFDAIVALGLLHEAGVARIKAVEKGKKKLPKNADIEYATPGEASLGKVNIATGKRGGVKMDADGGQATFFFNPDQKNHSASRQVYRLLVESGKIDPEKLEKDQSGKDYYERMIDFLESANRYELPKEVENMDVPARREWYKRNYARTLRGLYRYHTDTRKIGELLRFFKDGRDPDEPLSDDLLKDYKFIEKRTDEFTEDYSRKQQEMVVDKSLIKLKELEDNGLIIESGRYGKIAVDIGNSIKGGFEAVRYYGCGAYVIWDNKKQGFAVKTLSPITDEFIQGRRYGDKTLAKHPKNKARTPEDKQDLFITLEEVLGKMTDGQFHLSDELKYTILAERAKFFAEEYKEIMENYGKGTEGLRIMLENLLQRHETAEFSEPARPDMKAKAGQLASSLSKYNAIKEEIMRELDKLEDKSIKNDLPEVKKGPPAKQEEILPEPDKQAEQPLKIENWYTVVKPDGSYDFADIAGKGITLRLIDRSGDRSPSEIKAISPKNEIVLIITNGRSGFDLKNLTETDIEKIAFWAGNPELLPPGNPELARRYFEMADGSGEDYGSSGFMDKFKKQKEALLAGIEAEKAAKSEPEKDEKYFRSKYEHIMSSDMPEAEKDAELKHFYREIDKSDIDKSLFFRELEAEKNQSGSFEQLQRIIRGLEQNNKALAKEMTAEDLVEEIEHLRAEARTREIYDVDLVLIPEEYGIRDALKGLLKKEHDEFNKDYPVMVLPDDDAPITAKAQVIDVKGIMEDYARRIADRKKQELLNATERGMASTGESRFWSVLENAWGGFSRIRKWGKKSIVVQTEDAYYKKFYKEAYEAIAKHQNLLVDLKENYRLGKKSEVKDPDFKRDIHFEELDKIIQGYQRSAIELEERGNQIDNAEVHFMFKKMISHAVRFNWDRQKFERVQKEYINYMKKKGYLKDSDFFGASRKHEGEDAGKMFATNFYELTRSYKLHRIQKVNGIIKDHNLKKSEQVKALNEHIDRVMQLEILAGAKLAEIKNKRADHLESRMEKALIKLQNIPIIGRIASNPGVAAALFSVGSAAGSRWALRAAAGGALAGAGAATVLGGWAPILAAMAAGGIVGGIRRSKQVKDDLAMHKRDKTLGQKFYDFRRIKAERFDYDTKTAKELHEELAKIIGDPKSPRKFAELGEEEQKALASIYARFRVENDRYREYMESLADKKKFKKPFNRTVDLISVEGEEGEKYGSVLMSKTDLKIELYDYLRTNGLIKDEGSELSKNKDFYLLVKAEKEAINRNIDEMDKNADSYRKKSALTMGAIYGLSSGAGAMAGQEIFSKFADYKGWAPRYTAWDSVMDYFRQPGGRRIDSMLDKIMMGNKPVRAGMNRFGSIEIFINDNKTIDSSRTILPAGWKVAPDGKGIIKELFGGLGSLKPGPQEITVSGQKLEVLVNPDGKTFDMSKQLPPGWRYGNNGESLINAVGGGKETIDSSNFQNFARQIMGDKYTGQRVSYSKFMYQGSAPDKGIRGLPEILENRAHNRRLHANFTELMMQYKQAENGDVIVDVRQMFGKLLKADLKEAGVEMQKAIQSGKKFSMLLSLDNSKGGTQHAPIEFTMEKPGEIRIPKEAAKYFFAFDENGKLLQGSGRHPGLHSFVMDTGEVREKDGARKVIQISSTYGKKPNFEFEIPGQEIEYPLGEGKRVDLTEIPGKKFGSAYGFAPIAGSRWQLEDQDKSGDAGKTKKNERRREAAYAGLQSSLHELVSSVQQREQTREDLIQAIEASLSAEERESASRISGIKLIAEGGFADAFWERNKAIFTDRINLKRIFGKRLSAKSAGEIYNKLIRLEKDYRENGKIANTEAEAIEIAVYYNNYGKKVHLKNRITFGEFMFCIKRTLEEKLKIRKIKDQLAHSAAVAAQSAEQPPIKKMRPAKARKPADKK